jgi:hypothetical protein
LRTAVDGKRKCATLAGILRTMDASKGAHWRIRAATTIAVAVATGCAILAASSLASNSYPNSAAHPVTFATSSPAPPGDPEGSGAGEPVKFEEEPWNEEGARRAAEEAPRLEAEREAKKKEEEERPAKEAAARAVHEREIREAGERAGREQAERELEARSTSRCVVPRLTGDSLLAARRALSKDECRLGKVNTPRTHVGALVVKKQSARAGQKLAKGAAVAVTLGAAANTHGS